MARNQKISTLFRMLSLLLLVSCGGSKEGERWGISCDHPTTIRVVAEGLGHTNGEVHMALFASESGFPGEPERALQQGTATMSGEEATFVFEPVDCGTYAVSVIHDEDGNGEMKRDLLGRPKEGWGVSNNATGAFGPPSFKDASFDADSDSVTIRLKLRY